MTRRLRTFTISSAFVFGMLCLTGCGDKPAETLPGHQVKGKVTINGKEPGTYASVEFVSVANASETGSAGFDPAGNFAGRVPLGKCKVAIKLGTSGPPGGGGGGNPYGKGGGSPGGAGFPKGGGPGGPPGGGGPTGPPQTKGSDVPKKFTDVKTSGITVDVVEGQDLNIDFK